VDELFTRSSSKDRLQHVAGTGGGGSKVFNEVERDEQSQVFVKWERRGCWLVWRNSRRCCRADREYRSALTTFEGARRDVQWKLYSSRS